MKTGKRGRARVRGGPGTAARTVTVLSSVLQYAVRLGLRRDNPARGIALLKTQSRERYLNGEELGRLGDALTAAEAEGENQWACAAVRLLVLTGARKSEVLGLRWEWVDVERSCLRLPDSKTGKKVVPLGGPAADLLQSLPRFEGSPWVFPGARENKPLVGLPRAWTRIRKLAGLDGVRLHDLRHSFASVAVAGGDSLYLVGKVLGHAQARTTEKYSHVSADPILQVADRASRVIAKAMNKVPPPQEKGLAMTANGG